MNKLRREMLDAALTLLEQAATRVQSVREGQEEVSGPRAEAEVEALGEADEAITEAIAQVQAAMDGGE